MKIEVWLGEKQGGIRPINFPRTQLCNKFGKSGIYMYMGVNEAEEIHARIWESMVLKLCVYGDQRLWGYMFMESTIQK